MNELISKTRVSLNPGKLFDSPPKIYFKPQVSECPFCKQKLEVYCTNKRSISTLLIGAFLAHSTILYCPVCKDNSTYRPKELARIAPKGGHFGYDVMEYVGKAIFIQFCTQQEVVEGLQSKNIFISNSEVGYLARKFILYLSIVHKQSGKKIKVQIDNNGGYILHLDGTSEGASPHLISAIDQISQFVLSNIKTPSENADNIVPLLQKLKHVFGKPLAIVTDMGNAMIGAILKVFFGVLHFICHFHFLRDIGKDLLENHYSVIRNTLKKNAISKQLRYRLKQYTCENVINPGTLKQIIQNKELPMDLNSKNIKTVCYILITWALDGKNNGNGYGFPFDRPNYEFYNRLSSINQILTNWLPNIKDSKIKMIPLKLIEDLSPLLKDKVCCNAVHRITEKIEIFERLRQALRIALPENTKGLNDQGQDVDMKTIELQVTEFKNWLMGLPIYQNDGTCQKAIKQIDKYWEKLFAAPMDIETPKGKIKITPQRTNNILEQFFRGFKRDHRRTTGNNSIDKKLQTMLAQTPLIKNIQNPEYLKICLGDTQTLAERFSQIDDQLVRRAFKFSKCKIDKIPSSIKKTIRNQDQMKIFLNLFPRNLK